MSFQENEILKKLPKHLLEFVIDQPFNEYTARDHAVWRYVMRQNVRFLSKLAFGNYKEGLKKTGITVDSIPQMYGMNRILKEIGWAAVAVDGFIPPQAFMEFQAYKVLVIAADIRNVNHIEYTPAPDILHEAAGHAPIIANQEYAAYLKRFGEIGAKAFSSKKDYELYEAIRHLSIIKEDPSTDALDVKHAEAAIEEISANMGKTSEMALLRNLHWWTVEYGLIGNTDDFKIYGAGLLSSIGESQACLNPKIKKIPYSLDAQNYAFDITTMQPQLFVTKSFEELSDVLEQFADNMAFRKGGAYGLQIGQESADVSTIVFDTGLQLSGIIESFRSHQDQPYFIKLSGRAQICLSDKVIANQGIEHHPDGYSSPIGIPSIKGTKAGNAYPWAKHLGENLDLVFPGEILVSGRLKQIHSEGSQTLILSLEQCEARQGSEVLFMPDWGVFDVVLAERVNSVYYGPADPLAFKWHFESPSEKTHKLNYNDRDKQVFAIYQSTRKIRNEGSYQALSEQLDAIYKDIQEICPEEWLLKSELLELAAQNNLKALQEKLLQELENHATKQPELKKLITDAISLTPSPSHAL